MRTASHKTLTLEVGGSGARYSGVMYLSPMDVIMFATEAMMLLVWWLFPLLLSPWKSEGLWALLPLLLPAEEEGLEDCCWCSSIVMGARGGRESHVKELSEHFSDFCGFY
jgi:hypothetical protein